jgi:Tfp pilus assembly protein PilE
MLNARRYNKKGVTIAELIIGAVLVVILAGVVYNLYVYAKDAWLHVFVQGDMQAKAILAMERMVYGVDVDATSGYRKGIQEAQDILVPAIETSGSQIEFVDAEDIAVSRLFFQNGDRLIYTDDVGVNTDILDSDVLTLTFDRPAGQNDLVNITLILQRVVRGKTITVDLLTSVRLRNI